MKSKKLCRGLLLVDFVLVLVFSTLLSLATGPLSEANLDPNDVSAISAVNMQETGPPTSTPDPTQTAAPTPTIAPTPSPTPRNTPTEEPTKAPYIFPRPIYTREKPTPTRLR